MSAIDNFEVPEHGQQRTQERTKCIYFSDGSTMDVSDDVNKNHEANEYCGGQCREVSGEQPLEAELPVDPKTLSWPGWFKHYSWKGGSSVMNRLESAGESLAYFFGITAPKYQCEIDEYNRLVVKKNAHESEVKAWASTDPSTVPIVMEQIRTDKSGTPFHPLEPTNSV